MKRKVSSISNGILWTCMILILLVFFFYFRGGIKQPENVLLIRTDFIFILIYVFLFLILLVSLIFVIKKVVYLARTNSLSLLKMLIPVILLLLLVSGSFFLGNSTLSGEVLLQNTDINPLWMKIADMWLYSVAILLGLNLIGVIYGLFYRSNR